MTLNDPKVGLVAELELRFHTLQEQFPGKPAGAMSQKHAQSGCQLWPRQLLDGSELALTKQKQQANQCPNATYVSSKTAFLEGTSLLPKPSQVFLDPQKMGP
jgi:hypothetical protein